jgi:hypothetical protein
VVGERRNTGEELIVAQLLALNLERTECQPLRQIHSQPVSASRAAHGLGAVSERDDLS